MGKVFKEKIDIVIPWVDCNDEKWIKEKRKYDKRCNSDEGNNIARFRDWDNLKYVFRSIEKYAPWVNKIYFITCGHIPDWLDTNNKKLVIVNHKDFIPSEYLPTFSSHTIELNIFRIKQLNEKFIYFNDDIFLINETVPSDFFRKGLPCDSAILNTHCPLKSRIIYNIAFNDVRLINEHFNIKEVLKNNKNQWFNIRYGIKNNIQNIVFSRCPRFPGFKQFHMANSYLKSSFEKIWKLENDELNKTCLEKFRNSDQVNQWLIREYQLVAGKFIPTKKYKQGIMIDFEKQGSNTAIEICKKNINNKKYKMMCINDSDTMKNHLEIKKCINSLLEKKYPEKCTFEK